MKEQEPLDSRFDFDEWSALARNDPGTFDLKRRALIDDSIGHGTDQRRLRGLQCRIDLERMRAHTPLKACLRLSSLMWDSFNELHELTATLGNVAAPAETEARPNQAPPGAVILSFRKSSPTN